MSILSQEGELKEEFRRLTWSFMDPHATSKSRTCKDCHTSPKTLGLGYGTLSYQGKGNWRFTSAEKEKSPLLGIEFPLSALTDLQGRRYVHLSRKDLRPFNPEEMKRILRVGLCLECHPDFSDPVMRRWDREKICPVFKE